MWRMATRLDNAALNACINMLHVVTTQLYCKYDEGLTIDLKSPSLQSSGSNYNQHNKNNNNKKVKKYSE